MDSTPHRTGSDDPPRLRRGAGVLIAVFWMIHFSVQFVRAQLDPNSIKEIERVLNDLKANYSRITGQKIGQPSGPRIIH